jgi:hypothetical protein
MVEVELELGPTGDRVVAEHRLAEAERRLLEWSADVAMQEDNEAAYRAGLEARQEHVERRRGEVEACGLSSELETARATVRHALADEGALETDERRRLLAVVLERVVVRRTPRRGAPASERARLHFVRVDNPGAEDALELIEQAPA